MRDEIQKRYAPLAESSCCLSCGGAIGHADARPGEVAVDLGSGRGTDVLRLAGIVGPKGRAFGIDVTGAMLDRSRRDAEKLGVKNAEFRQAPMESTRLADRTADLVISNCTINHAADKAAVWDEIFRILKPGGRFVVSDIYAAGEIDSADRDDPGAVAECWAGAVPKGEYVNTVESAGFENIRILEESSPYEKGRTTVASFTIAGRKPA